MLEGHATPSHTPGELFSYRRPGFSNPFIGSPIYDVAEVLPAGGQADANAARIVKACNCHDELVAALLDATQALTHAIHFLDAHPFATSQAVSAALARAHAICTKAGG